MKRKQSTHSASQDNAKRAFTDSIIPDAPSNIEELTELVTNIQKKHLVLRLAERTRERDTLQNRLDDIVKKSANDDIYMGSIYTSWDGLIGQLLSICECLSIPEPSVPFNTSASSFIELFSTIPDDVEDDRIPDIDQIYDEAFESSFHDSLTKRMQNTVDIFRKIAEKIVVTCKLDGLDNILLKKLHTTEIDLSNMKIKFTKTKKRLCEVSSKLYAADTDLTNAKRRADKLAQFAINQSSTKEKKEERTEAMAIDTPIRPASELEVMLASQTQAIEDLNAEKIKLKQEIEEIKSLPVSEESVNNSASFKKLQAQFHRLSDENRHLASECKDTKQQLADNKETESRRVGDLNSERKRQKKIFDKESEKLKENIQRIRRQRDESEKRLDEVSELFSLSEQAKKDYREKDLELSSLKKELKKLRLDLDHALKIPGASFLLAKQGYDFKAKEDDEVDLDFDSLKELNEALLSEIDSMASSFDSINAENLQLNARINEMDLTISRLIGEKLKIKQLHSACQAEKAAVEKLIEAEKELRTTQASHLKELENLLSVTKHAADLVKEEDKAKTYQIRDLTLSLNGHNQEVDNLKVELSTEKTNSEALQKRISDIISEHESAMAKKDAKKWQTSSKSSLSDSELEIESLKAKLRCSVCSQRMKQVVITKCFHCFCNPCIQLNLAARHRKCPGCGKPFGQDDVHTLYLIPGE